MEYPDLTLFEQICEVLVAIFNWNALICILLNSESRPLRTTISEDFQSSGQRRSEMCPSPRTSALLRAWHKAFCQTSHDFDSPQSLHKQAPSLLDLAMSDSQLAWLGQIFYSPSFEYRQSIDTAGWDDLTAGDISRSRSYPDRASHGKKIVFLMDHPFRDGRAPEGRLTLKNTG